MESRNFMAVQSSKEMHKYKYGLIISVHYFPLEGRVQEIREQKSRDFASFSFSLPLRKLSNKITHH